MATHKVTLSPDTEPQALANGPAAAAILAGGIGCAWYGLMVIAVEVSPGFKSLLTFSTGVGPLSGKTTLGMVGWLVAWVILHSSFKGKDVDLDRMITISLALVALGVLFTFPPFFAMFAVH